MGHHVTRMFHPSHRVPDLGAAEEFFARVFGRPSTMMYDLISPEIRAINPAYPRDYCTFTPIQDVFFDTIDPKRYVIEGEQRYPTVNVPHLKSFGFYVEEIESAYAALRANGFRVVDQLNRVAEGDRPPHSSSRPMVLFWAHSDDAGLGYEFFPADHPFPGDPRPEPGWTLPPVDPADPLGIEHCSHHTVLTRDPARGVRLLVDVLGGEVVHEGPNHLLGTQSVYVHLAGSIVEYARVLDDDTPAAADLRGTDPQDCYHAITWKVRDLDAVATHLKEVDVLVRTRTDTTLVTDPASSLGIPWGFTTTPPVAP